MKRVIAAMTAALLLVSMVSIVGVSAASQKWTLSYYDGDDGPLTEMAANPQGKNIATFAFDADPNQALLTSDASGYVKKGSLLGKTVTATISITGVAGTTFVGYDTGCSTPPTVRFYFDTKEILGAETSFQSGLYENQLWWSNPVSISLADVFAAGPAGAPLSVSFAPANWSNLVGVFGDDLVGSYSSDFSLAASNVSKVGFSFGSGCSFAFGDGSNPDGAMFNLMKFSTFTPSN